MMTLTQRKWIGFAGAGICAGLISLLSHDAGTSLASMPGANALFVQPVHNGGLIPSEQWQPATQPDNEDDADDTDRMTLKPLTPEQISRIRYMELRGMRTSSREPDRVTVKISKDVIDEFLLSMEGHEDFRNRRAKPEFLKMTPPQKLHVITRYRGAEYADKVRIQSDPEIFVEFRKNVLPVVLRSCATSGCHTTTNRDVKGFAFINDPKRTDQAVYSNFVIMNDIQVRKRRLIDRSQPDNSLLLTFMLPKNEVRPEFRHPGDVEFQPAFRSRKHPRYLRLLNWIESLKHPAEDYGVRLLPPPPNEVEEDDDDDLEPTAPAGANRG